MRRYRIDRARKISYIAASAAAAAGLLFSSVYSQMVSHMKEICEYKGRQTANEVVSKAIDAQLKDGTGDYLNIKYDENGRIIALSADADRINALENDLKSAVTDSLAHIDDNEMGVPLGTLTGITLFSGRGMDINIKLHQVGAVDAHIVSEFTSAGINQTKHSLKIEIKTELSAILPGHSTDITMNDEYIIGETIIVGELPQGVVSSVEDYIV